MLIAFLNQLASKISEQATSLNDLQANKISIHELIMLGVLEPPGEPVVPPKGSQSELMRTAEGCEKLSKMEDDRPEVQLLFGNMKKESDNFFELLESCDGEDLLYRFYHGSFKCYGLQQHTKKIVENLQKLLPERDLNELFMAIVREGTGKE